MKSLKYTLLLSFVLVSFCVNARDTFYARVSGAWNTAATWSTTPGGSADTGGAVPGQNDDVFTEGFVVNVTSSTVSCNNLYVAHNVANGINVGIAAGRVNIYGFLASYDKSAFVFAVPTVAIIKNSTSLLTIYFLGLDGTEAISSGDESGPAWGPNAPLRNIFFDPGAGQKLSIPDLSIASGGLLTVVSGTLETTGTILAAGATAGITVNSGSALLVSTGNIRGTLASLTSNFPTLTNNGTIISSPNATSFINCATVNLNAGSTFNVGFNGANQTEGWWYQTTAPSSIVANQTSTVNYNSSTSQNVHAHAYGNLTLGGTGTLTKTVAGTGSINVKGSLSFGNAGITLNVPAANQTIFDGTNGQSINGNGTANFNGGLQVNKSAGILTVSQNISIQNGLTLTSGEMVFGSNTINLSGNLVNNATLTSSSSTLNINGTTVVSGSSVTNLNNLTIAGGGTLTPPATTLNVAGNFVNNGVFIPNNGTIGFNGISPQAVSGTNANFNNISVNSTSSITLSSAQNLTGALSMAAGTFASNGNLTLVSNASGDARIAEITGGSISGNINVQRYIPTGTAAYRYLASPLTNATAAQWKSAFPITGTFTDASTQAEWPSIAEVADGVASAFAYNESSAQASLDDRYESFPADGSSSSGTSLVNGKGYAVYIYDANQPTYTLTGTPKTGAVNVSITAQSGGSNDGWNLVGNPYPSPINWDNVTIPPAMNDQVSIMDNTGTGGFVYYSQGVGTDTFSGVIAMGQAFWVKANSSTVLSFKEGDKANVNSPSFYREGEMPDLLRIKIKGSTHTDDLALYFRDEAKDVSESRYDALKRTNPVGFINFSSFSSDDAKLAINAMSTLGCGKEVKLSVDGVTPGAYSFNFSNLGSFKTGLEIKLTDNFTGKTQSITSAATTYDFEVTANAASYGANRFKLNFGYPSPIITEIGSSTLQSNYDTGNQWYLNNKLIAGATGKTLDVKESGIYKLKVTTEGGCETLVEKEMIVTGLEDGITSRQIYPNPVSSVLSIKLQASNGDAIGVIQNELGQTVGNVAFTSADNFLIGEFNFEEKMSGIYIVRITQGNSVTNHKIVKR